MYRVTDPGSIAQQIAARVMPSTVMASVAVGQVVAVSDGGATINLGGVNIVPALMLSPIPANVGDNILVLMQAGFVYGLGPVGADAMPYTGTVTSVPAGSSLIVVSTSVGSLSCMFPSSYAPAVNDAVYLTWAGSQPIVLGKQGGTPAAAGVVYPVPTPKPPPTVVKGTSTFQARDAATYNPDDGGWRNDDNGDVIQGEWDGYGLNNGAWFYHGQVRSSLAGATVTGASIWLGRGSGGWYQAETCNLYRVANDSRPGGNVTFDTGHAFSAALSVGQSGWFPVPVSVAQALVTDGGSIGCEAPSGSPYMRMYGLSSSGSAGSLRISWQKG